MTTVHVIDDHELYARSVSDALAASGHFEVVEITQDPQQVAGALARSRADVVLLDLHLGDRSGLELLHRALTVRPDLRVLVISAETDRSAASLALRTGARGFLNKSAPPHELPAALLAVASGEFYLHSGQLASVMSPAAGVPDVSALSVREQIVVHTLARQGRIVDVARRLDLSRRTVETHVANICHKIGVRGVRSLRQAAKRIHPSI